MNPSPNKDDNSKDGDQNPFALSDSASSCGSKQPLYLQIPPDLQQQISSAFQRANSEDRQYKVEQPVKVDVIKDEELSGFEKKTVRFGYWGLVIAGFSLLAAVGAARIFFQQFKEMAAQTEFLARSAKQARIDSVESHTANAKQFRALQGQIAIARSEERTLQGQLLQQQESMRLSERAWVGFTGIDVITLKAGSKFVFIGYIKNFGETPALNTTVMTHWRSILSTIPPPISEDMAVAPIGEATLQPGVKLSFNGIEEAGDTPMTDAQVQAVSAGLTTLYMYADVEYDDIFGKHHFSHACATVDPKNFKMTHPCKQYNGTDQDRQRNRDAN